MRRRKASSGKREDCEKKKIKRRGKGESTQKKKLHLTKGGDQENIKKGCRKKGNAAKGRNTNKEK